MSVKTKNCR